ncbi:MAG: T9SS type A sorting domain-containing protein [Treponema sp.]|nr:T9SS type A sorting domain-containing protein [Treponema sp.]
MSAGIDLYNYEFPSLAENATMDFFFHLSTSPADLYAARLDIAAGEPIPAGWYNRVKPFSFGMHNITRQRGGVTILNNVINSNRREHVFLDYTLKGSGRVTIQVFTLDGNLVKVLKRESQGAGDYRVSWDGTNNGGRSVARGMYFIRVVAPDIDEIRKVMVVK